MSSSKPSSSSASSKASASVVGPPTGAGSPPPLQVTFDLPTEVTQQRDLAQLIQSQAKILQELGILSLQIQGQEVLTVARPARGHGTSSSSSTSTRLHNPASTDTSNAAHKNSLLVNLLSNPSQGGAGSGGNSHNLHHHHHNHHHHQHHNRQPHHRHDEARTSLVNPNTGELESGNGFETWSHSSLSNATGSTTTLSSLNHGRHAASLSSTSSSSHNNDDGKKVKLKLRLPVEKRNLSGSGSGTTSGEHRDATGMKTTHPEPKLPKLILSMRDKTVKMAAAAAAAASSSKSSRSSASAVTTLSSSSSTTTAATPTTTTSPTAAATIAVPESASSSYHQGRSFSSSSMANLPPESRTLSADNASTQSGPGAKCSTSNSITLTGSLSSTMSAAAVAAAAASSSSSLISSHISLTYASSDSTKKDDPHSNIQSDLASDMSKSHVSSLANNELPSGLEGTSVPSSTSVTLINLPYSNTSCEDSGIESNDTLSDKSPGHVSELVRGEDCLSSPSNYVMSSSVLVTSNKNNGSAMSNGKSPPSISELDSKAPLALLLASSTSSSSTSTYEPKSSESKLPSSGTDERRSTTQKMQSSNENHHSHPHQLAPDKLTNGVSSSPLNNCSSSTNIVSQSPLSVVSTGSSSPSPPASASSPLTSSSMFSQVQKVSNSSANNSGSNSGGGGNCDVGTGNGGANGGVVTSLSHSTATNSKMVPVKLVTVSGEGNVRLVRVSPVKAVTAGQTAESQNTKTVFIKSVAPKVNGSITIQGGGNPSSQPAPSTGGTIVEGLESIENATTNNQTISSSASSKCADLPSSVAASSSCSSSSSSTKTLLSSVLTNGVVSVEEEGGEGGSSSGTTCSSSTTTTLMTLARNGGLPKSTTLSEVKATKRPAPSELPSALGVPNTKMIKVGIANSEQDGTVNNTRVDHNSKDSGSLALSNSTTTIGGNSTIAISESALKVVQKVMRGNLRLGSK